jgi:valyl-tRNA synthetase
MESRYEHNLFEQKIYDAWDKAGVFDAFDADQAGDKKPFCVIMPPPNANDPLHVGHAMFISVEDIYIRYHRMLGEAALWLPGTDHAGIETQYVFEKKLAKEGKSRFQFDRETLFHMIWDYVQENSEVALSQMRHLGASADWKRKQFTLNPGIIDQVLHTL